MTLPTATYRLQFRQGMDFVRASGLAPYLRQLGISHLYASPVFTAQTGSTHGYDVTDPGEVDPVLGGIDGLRRLSAALRAEGLGLILDIVPNHLAFSVETPWLRDVLRHGTDSAFAGHFDMELAQERLRLPWLEAPFEAVLAAGGLAVEEAEDGPVLSLGGLKVPLAATPALEEARAGGAEALRRLHAEQPWRLTHWRTEGDALSHRRFFNVTGLIGLRVEEERVFEDAHRLLFELLKEGIADGVRIDHVDGLADPAGYLRRLRDRVGETPLWVEKILTGPEMLPDAWPVQGTTGYVAARAFNRLLTKEAGLERVATDYRAATGRTDPVEEVLYRARLQIMTHDLAAELWTLHRQLAAIASDDPEGVELGPESLREALLAFIAAFPRYRTYSTATEIREADAALIARTAQAAGARLSDSSALDFLAAVLGRATPATARFRIRLQQVTGAAVAKSQEDTAFFRDVRLLSANEVGGEAGDHPLGIRGFHRAMAQRAELMPQGLTLTSSHDTKRSEDARMRIAAITYAPEAFEAWFRICRGFAPDRLNPNLVWYVAQTFLALDPGEADFGDRLAEHVVKALREAKSETFWTDPDLELEAAAQAYVRRLAEHFPSPAREVAPILAIADRLSLVQAALKLTVPGIPDIYQGCEVANYALTDPDNRRAVDFPTLAQGLEDPARLSRPLDRQKMRLTHRLLGLRRDRPALFRAGGYEPVEAGPGICAFRRSAEGAVLEVTLAVGTATLPEVPAQDGTAQPETEGALPGRIWPPEGEADVGPVRITLT